MPYMVKKEGDQFGVYKQDADKKPTGKALGMHPSRAKANEQMKALYASEPGVGSKQMYDMPPMMKLEPDDPRAMYNPLAGTGTQACANCQWFCAAEAACCLIWDDVVATGKCNLWLGEPPKADVMMQNPIPVVVVDMPVETGSAEFAVPANHNHPDKLPIDNKTQIEGAITSIMTGQFRGNEIKPALTPAEKSAAKGKIKKAINASGESQDWKDQELARLEGKEFPELIEPVKPGVKEKIVDWVVRVFGKKEDDDLLLGGFKALPNGKWIAYHTNNFEDRVGETFTQASHEQYIEWLEKEQIPYPELWYRHIAGTKHGQAEWVGQIGHLIVSVGSFDDTEVARLFQKEYEKHPYQTSHTYAYPPSARDTDGTYHAYFTIEISPVPAGLAANPYTTFMEVKEVAKSKEENRKALLPILGKEWTDKLLGDGDNINAALEKAGLKSKEIEGLPIVDAELRAAFQAFIVTSKEDGDAAQKTLVEQLNAIATGIKAIQDGEKARNDRLTQLETFVKEQFADAPRATTSKQTVVPATDPQVAALAAKAADPTATTPNPNATPGESIAAMLLNFAPKGQS